MKHDQHARNYWGKAYDDIPKAVWATLAWHLANVASGLADTPGMAEAKAVEEMQALNAQIIPEKQATAAERALQRAYERRITP